MTGRKESTMNERQTKAAADFCAAIREIGSKPENLDNLESYLSAHFSEQV